MGCDIHGYLEIKKDGVWKIEENIPCDRNYGVFGILAGVRNYANSLPIDKPRGIPDDASSKVKRRSYGLDYHSRSWLDVNDFLKYDWNHRTVDGRKSTVERATGREISKSSYSARWDTQPDEHKYAHLERTAVETLSNCWFEYFCKMVELAIIYDGPENVRIVFWFDN